MENSIKVLEKEVKELQELIKINMVKCGNYLSQLELLIGEHLTAISHLKSVGKLPLTVCQLTEVAACKNF